MKKLILILSVVFYTTLAFSQEFGTFTDPRDGKIYKTSVVLGNTWLAENLAYEVDDEGSHLPTDSLTIGYVYTWEIAKNVCPQGWRLPTKEDIDELQDYYGTGYSYYPGGMSGLELDNVCLKIVSGKKKYSYFHFWTSTAGYNEKAWYYNTRCKLYNSPKSQFGFVRCIKK